MVDTTHLDSRLLRWRMIIIYMVQTCPDSPTHRRIPAMVHLTHRVCVRRRILRSPRNAIRFKFPNRRRPSLVSRGVPKVTTTLIMDVTTQLDSGKPLLSTSRWNKDFVLSKVSALKKVLRFRATIVEKMMVRSCARLPSRQLSSDASNAPKPHVAQADRLDVPRMASSFPGRNS